MALTRRSSICPATVVVACLAFAPAAAAPPPTFSRTNLATGGFPVAVATGDLNGDLRP